jgi:hypothetical protein
MHPEASPFSSSFFPPKYKNYLFSLLPQFQFSNSKLFLSISHFPGVLILRNKPLRAFTSSLYNMSTFDFIVVGSE